MMHVWRGWAGPGRVFATSVCGVALAGQCAAASADLMERVTHRYATNAGVRIHYVTLGQGPALVMLHGFPDFWYTWRHQMTGLADRYQVVALDLRGYNLSDRPAGVTNYTVPHLVGDVLAVIRDLGRTHVILAGHDWGGMVAWATAMEHPAAIERLIICNLPHPRGFMRELANNPQQQANSEYARRFQMDGAHTNLTAEGLAQWVRDPAARARYLEAFRRSDFEAMLSYYKANYPRPPYREDAAPSAKVRGPVLVVHGLRDTALLAGALNNTWEWIEGELTLVTIPEAGHFVQQDAPERLTSIMRSWLERSAAKPAAPSPERTGR